MEKHSFEGPEKRKDMELRTKLDIIFGQFQERHPFEPNQYGQKEEIKTNEDIVRRIGTSDELTQMIKENPSISDDEKSQALEIAGRWYRERREDYLNRP